MYKATYGSTSAFPVDLLTKVLVFLQCTPRRLLEGDLFLSYLEDLKTSKVAWLFLMLQTHTIPPGRIRQVMTFHTSEVLTRSTSDMAQQAS